MAPRTPPPHCRHPSRTSRRPRALSQPARPRFLALDQTSRPKTSRRSGPSRLSGSCRRPGPGRRTSSRCRRPGPGRRRSSSRCRRSGPGRHPGPCRRRPSPSPCRRSSSRRTSRQPDQPARTSPLAVDQKTRRQHARSRSGQTCRSSPRPRTCTHSRRGPCSRRRRTGQNATSHGDRLQTIVEPARATFHFVDTAGQRFPSSLDPSGGGQINSCCDQLIPRLLVIAILHRRIAENSRCRRRGRSGLHFLGKIQHPRRRENLTGLALKRSRDRSG